MATDDFFRARLDQMIDLRHPLVVLAGRTALGPDRSRFGAGLCPQQSVGPGDARQRPVRDDAGDCRCRGQCRRPATFADPADGSAAVPQARLQPERRRTVARWTENVVWQYFSGLAYYTPNLPCDATQIGRFRAAIGEAGVEELLKATIDTAVQTKAVRPAEFERVIVDTTVQEKAIAHPVDSRLLEIARAKVVQAAKRVGISLKQTFAKEGKELRRKAGGYAHAKQFKRLRRTVKRQRTMLGIVLREIGRKLASATTESPSAIAHLTSLLERAERIRTQQPKDKNKFYALHAPEVECIGKGKARKPYEFGVKASIAVTHKSGLMVGARTFPGNPYDGHILSAQLEQTRILLEDVGREPKEVVVDLGFRGVDATIPGGDHPPRQVQVADPAATPWLKRRQAVEPAIGHLKSDHRMDRCWLQGNWAMRCMRCCALRATTCAGCCVPWSGWA